MLSPARLRTSSSSLLIPAMLWTGFLFIPVVHRWRFIGVPPGGRCLGVPRRGSPPGWSSAAIPGRCPPGRGSPAIPGRCSIGVSGNPASRSPFGSTERALPAVAWSLIPGRRSMVPGRCSTSGGGTSPSFLLLAEEFSNHWAHCLDGFSNEHGSHSLGRHCCQ